MYRRILVPIDGSATSTLGLRHAVGLAKDQGARLRVLNVLDDKLAVPGIDAYAAADLTALIGCLNTEGRKSVKEAAALAAKNGVKADTQMTEGRGRFVSDVVIDDAKTWRADLIVMGTHGRRGWNRLLLGSDAERVLRDSPVPVLLVRGARTENGAASKRARKSR